MPRRIAMADAPPVVEAPRTFTVTLKDDADPRAALEEALGDLPVLGFRVNTRDRPCPTCGRLQRTAIGTATVTVASNDPDAALFDRLADVLGDTFVGDLRGGAA
jgi:hypothetical protein